MLTNSTKNKKKHGLDVGLKSLTSVMEKVNRNPTYNMHYFVDILVLTIG